MQTADQIVSKTELARQLQVSKQTVSSWIARGQLSKPALRPDGRINLELARAQIAERVGVKRVEPIAAAARGPGSERAQQLLDARAQKAQIDAELARRKLEEQRGRYVLASQVAETWAAGIAGFLETIEGRFSVLDREMQLGWDMRRFRTWWTETRALMAAQAAARAATTPEFVGDPGRG